MINAKEIFDAVNSIGEKDSGIYHIIDMSEDYPVHEDEKKYRIYHNGGYCFEVAKEVADEDEKTGVITWDYTLYQEWDGFDAKIENTEQALHLLKDR